MANTTWNPSDKTASLTLSNANLTGTATGAGFANARSVDRQITGKFYWECTFTNITNMAFGIASPAVVLGSINISGAGGTGTAFVNNTGNLFVNGTSMVPLGGFANGGVGCIALDLTNQLIWIRNGAAGNWNNSGSANPATGVNGFSIPLGGGIPAHALLLGTSANPNGAVTANFGDTAFVGGVPSGFTSGFTAGASVPTNAIASQALAEHWLTTDPDARITSVVAEHWASVTSGNLQAIATQVLVEHWASVASVSPAAGGPIVTMIH